MHDWDEVRAWRRSTRAKLISRRVVVLRAERDRVRWRVAGLVREQFPELAHACLSFYWPFKGELDLRPLARNLLALGAEAALPVVVEKQRPLEFWAWQPRMKLSRGVWNIPIPGERNPVRPTALLVPLLGFDGAGYRLGYGGGYYDRTLTSLHPKPLTIGVGFESGRLPTIHPQPHDIALDAIVTERGVTRFRYRGQPLASEESEQGAVPGEGASFASPPCFLHEMDADYLGAMSTPDTVALLNQLLEGERAGARAVGELAKQTTEAAQRTVLRDIAMDEARCCAMLTRHIVRLGGAPSSRTGAFYDRLLAEKTPAARIALLDRGQAWVVRKLNETLPRIRDDALHADLKEMLDVHVHNLKRGRCLPT